MPTRQELLSKLTQARRELADSQTRVAELEALLSDDPPNSDPSPDKNVEEVLRESEARYRLLAENATDLVFRQRLDGVYLYVSPSSRALVGYDPEEMVGRSSWIDIHPEDHAVLQAAIRSLMTQHLLAMTTTFRFRHKDGHYVWLESTGRLILSPTTGEPLELRASARDVTERKQADEALQTSIAEIHDLYNNAPCGYHSLDKDGLIVQINDTELRWLGYNRDEVVGKLKIEDIFTPASVLEFRRNFPLFKARGWVHDLEFEVIRKDGSVIPLLLSGTAIYDERGQYLRSRSTFFDITELRKARLAVVESEARYRLLAENVTDVIVKVSPDGIQTFITPSCYVLLGYTPQELIGTSGFDLAHPDDRAAMQSVVAQAIGSPDSSFSFVERVRHKAGHYVWIEATNSILRDPDTGRAVEIVAVLRNIAERKRAEEALNARLEEERELQNYLMALHEITIELAQINQLDEFFRRTVELGLQWLGFERLSLFLYDASNNTAIGTYGTDPQGRLVDEHHLRFVAAPDGIMGRALRRVERFYVDEQVRLSGSYEETLGTGWNAAVILWNGTQSLGWMVADNLRSHQPASKAMLNVMSLYALSVGALLARKQTEVALRESEAKYRLLVETMRGGLAMYDLDERITYVNDQFCQMLGYRRDELIGTRSFDYVDDANAEKINQQLGPRRRLESTSYELVARRKDGEPVHLLISGSPLLDADGVLIGSFAVTTDITAQKQAEEALRQAFEKEKELSELKSRFVSMASHEFRTPLATILALTETLSAYRSKMTEEQIEQRLGRIREQVGRLRDIMEDVLQLARLQARRAEFNPVPAKLDSLCRSILDEFQNQPGITHQIVYTCSDPRREVNLDSKLMRQVLSNLVSNAIKYSLRDKVITVRLEYTADALVLSVHDTGIGIPESDLKHLFEPFHRGANVGTISGTGLGLVITKESVELHGGTITVESQVDTGTTFRVNIPITSGEGQADHNSHSYC